MIHKTAVNIINWQIEKGSLSEKERNKYVYAYEILLNQVINLSIAVLLALVSKEAIAVFLFLGIYIPLRKYAGGFHAKNNERCILYSSLVIMGVILLNKWLSFYAESFETVMTVCTLLLLSFVWQVAPIDTENKKLEDAERNKYRKKVHMFCVMHIFLMIFNLLLVKRTDLCINILLAYITSCFVLIMEYKKQKYQ